MSQERLTSRDIVEGKNDDNHEKTFSVIPYFAYKFTSVPYDHQPATAQSGEVKGAWFKPGRVFSVPWHEAVCSDDADGSYEKDRSTRRMVVIRKREGYCWSAPIKSYADLGVATVSLSDREKQQHTIIHNNQSSARSYRADLIKSGEKFLNFLQNVAPNFDDWPCALSCVLNSVRPLSVTELQSAVRLYRNSTNRPDKEGQTDALPLINALQHPSTVFREDDAGYVHFLSPAMYTYLRIFRIKGLDPSHKTIASSCVAELASIKAANNADTGARDGGSAFATYAREHWRYHCEAASASGPLLIPASKPPKPQQSGDTCNEEACVTAQHSPDLNTKDNAEDWVYVL